MERLLAINHRLLVDADQSAARAVGFGGRIKAARFPVIKTLAQFRWDWPKKINRLAVQILFRREFLQQKANVILLGNVGLGQTHLATARGYAACQKGFSVFFADAISVINDLSAAQKRGLLKRYLKPELLLLDQIGYPPIDQPGAAHTRDKVRPDGPLLLRLWPKECALNRR